MVNGVTIPLGFVNTSSKVSQDQFNGLANFDWNMRGHSALGVRYVHNDTGTDTFNSGLPAFAVPGHRRALLGAVTYTATPTPALTFNGNVGYNRLDQKIGGGDFIFPDRRHFRISAFRIWEWCSDPITGWAGTNNPRNPGPLPCGLILFVSCPPNRYIGSASTIPNSEC